MSLSSALLTIGMLIADITQQYAQVRPWLVLEQGAQRPACLRSCRRSGTRPVWCGCASWPAASPVARRRFAFHAHNVASGMHDYKPEGPDPLLRDTGNGNVNDLAVLLAGATVRCRAGAGRGHAEYSTTTELADVLQRDADAPFRFVIISRPSLATHGRANQLRPGEIL